MFLDCCFDFDDHFLLTGCLQIPPVQCKRSRAIIRLIKIWQSDDNPGCHALWLQMPRQDEYDAGHIPGAILIPNESIEA